MFSPSFLVVAALAYRSISNQRHLTANRDKSINFSTLNRATLAHFAREIMLKLLSVVNTGTGITISVSFITFISVVSACPYLSILG